MHTSGKDKMMYRGSTTSRQDNMNVSYQDKKVRQISGPKMGKMSK